MRKIILCVLAAAMIIGIAGCGSSNETNASAKAQSIARQAIECVDDYLDGTMSGKAAYDKLGSLYLETDYVSDMPQETSEEVSMHVADFCIRSSVGSLRGEIYNDFNFGNNEIYDEIIKIRNELAEEIGMDKR